jgi:hypothetical protein
LEKANFLAVDSELLPSLFSLDVGIDQADTILEYLSEPAAATAAAERKGRKEGKGAFLTSGFGGEGGEMPIISGLFPRHGTQCVVDRLSLLAEKIIMLLNETHFIDIFSLPFPVSAAQQLFIEFLSFTRWKKSGWRLRGRRRTIHLLI